MSPKLKQKFYSLEMVLANLTIQFNEFHEKEMQCANEEEAFFFFLLGKAPEVGEKLKEHRTQILVRYRHWRIINRFNLRKVQ